MPIAKAATNVQLASQANWLRLTLICDRMTEFLCMATEKTLTPREMLKYFFTQEILRREENRIRQGIMAPTFPWSERWRVFLKRSKVPLIPEF